MHHFMKVTLKQPRENSCLFKLSHLLKNTKHYSIISSSSLLVTAPPPLLPFAASANAVSAIDGGCVCSVDVSPANAGVLLATSVNALTAAGRSRESESRCSTQFATERERSSKEEASTEDWKEARSGRISREKYQYFQFCLVQRSTWSSKSDSSCW